MKNWINVLKFVAVILITNSHFDYLYPQEIKFLASGGSIGNCLFFFTSGYLLYTSAKTTFADWIKKRIVRIYPAVFIFIFIYYTIIQRPIYFETIIYPTIYWFIAAIIFFYILYYFIGKYLKEYYVHLFLFLFIPYFIWYVFFLNISVYTVENPNYFKWIYYFQIMLLGSIIAKNEYKIKVENFIINVFMLMLTLILFIGIKFFMGKTIYLPFQLQCLMQIISFPIMFYFYKVFVYISDSIVQYKVVSKVIKFISDHTLEIYITQFAWIVSPFIAYFAFPVNILINLICIIISAYLLKKASILFLSLFSETAKTR